MQEDKDPYSNHDFDDWQWEFLRRNPRYIKAYKANEWLKRRLNKNTPRFRPGSFKAFGVYCSFTWIQIGNQYKGWRYDGGTHKTKSNIVELRNDVYSGLLDLPSPDSNTREYKERLRKKEGAVFEIDRDMQGEEPWDFWMPSQLKEHEIAVVIDTRYSLSEIKSELKDLLEVRKDKQRHHVRLYPDYLAVWDLRKEGLTDTQIAQRLWPDEYATNGGRDSGAGDKGSLIQRVYDNYDAVKKLIDNSFQRRSPKIKK
jgi:hypothetical protein